MRKAQKDNYAKIRERFNRRFSALQDWLADPSQHIPKAWYESGNPIQGVPISKQLPIYQPDKKLTPQSLSAYLQEEQQAHQGTRLLSIPLYINPHWVVLTLYFDKDNQLGSAAYIDSVADSQPNMLAENQPIPLKRSNPLYQALQSIYPNFKKEIQQYQHYLHEGNVPSEFAMVENAGQMVKRFYFGHRFPVTSTLWSGALTPIFEQMPDELWLYITSMLDTTSRLAFSKSNERSYAIAEDQAIWQKLYQTWSRYVVPSFPSAKKQPDCYKTEFKRLYLTLTPKQKALIKAAMANDRATLEASINDLECRDQLRIIAACHGDIALLKKVTCSADTIISLGLCHYSYDAPHRQQVLDYFWEIVSTEADDQYELSRAHWAALLNQPKALKVILEKDPDLAERAGNNNITPLMCAKHFKYKACVAEFAAIDNTKVLDKDAASSGLVHLLSTDDFIPTSLFLILFGYGASINFDNPLVFNGLFGKKLTFLLRPLLLHGLDINLKSSFGSLGDFESILISFSTFGSVSNILFLLAYGADPYLKNKNERNALDGAKAKAINNRNTKNKNACVIALAMFLKGADKADAPTLQEVHDYDPEYFEVLIQDILDAKSPWVWITEEMVDRLIESPLVKGFEYQKEIQSQLQKRFEALSTWLIDPTVQQPKAWMGSSSSVASFIPQGIAKAQQRPLYQPTRKILCGAKRSASLQNYLRYEKKQHDGARILVIPIYVRDHWSVLVLEINTENTLQAADYVSSLASNAASVDDIDSLNENIKAVYSEFRGSIRQQQCYYHTDSSYSRFILFKNAEDVVKHVYFREQYQLVKKPWVAKKQSTFGGLPDELHLAIASMLNDKSVVQYGLTNKKSSQITQDNLIWKKSYEVWARYLLPPIQNVKQPQCYKTALKKLYLSTSPLERKLIKAAIAGDKKTVCSFVRDQRLRDRLLVIGACDGDVNLLKQLRCNAYDIERLPLIAHCGKNQAVLDYFWKIVRIPLADKAIDWAAMLNQTTFLEQKLQFDRGLAKKANVLGITPVEYAEYYNCSALKKDSSEQQHDKDYPLIFDPWLCDINSLLLLLELGEIDLDALSEEYMQHYSNPGFSSASQIKRSGFNHLIIDCGKQFNYCLDRLRLLLEFGINPNAFFKNDETPLQIAIQRYNQKEAINVSQLLLAYDADPNIKSQIGGFPLIIALQKSNNMLIDLLLTYGADPNLSNGGDNDLALNTAVCLNNPEAVNLLLKYGANPFLKDSKEMTALNFAEKFEYIAIPVFLLVAMHLKNQVNSGWAFGSVKTIFRKPVPYLKKAYHYNPDAFKTLIEDIIYRNIWPWVTKEMKQRLLNDPFVRTLDLTMQSEVGASVAQKGA